jgi:hypothetical protein
MEAESDGHTQPTEGSRAAAPSAEPATGAGHGREAPPGAPRWVKISGAVALAVVVLFLVLHLTGSGMGPGMHGGQ